MKSVVALTMFIIAAPCLTVQAQPANLRQIDIARQLNTGFAAKDVAPLRECLSRWHAASEAVPTNVLAKKPRFEQTVYALYGAFFIPDASRADADYVVIQGDIDVHLVEADLAEAYREELRTYEEVAERMPAISKYTIHDFRPDVAVNGKKVLYFNLTCVDAMLQFLTGKGVGFEKSWEEPNGHDLLTNEHNERKSRLDYLNNCLHIVPGHWGTGWHFATHPKIMCLVLSTDRDVAVVYYRSGYEGGAALLRLREDKWEVIDRQMTWVE